MVQNYKIAHKTDTNGCFLSNAKAVFTKCKKRLEITCLPLRPNLINHRYELDNLILGRIV